MATALTLDVPLPATGTLTLTADLIRQAIESAGASLTGSEGAAEPPVPGGEDQQAELPAELPAGLLLPTNTAVPQPTATSAPPTATAVPTATASPTITPPPTATPTVTPTPTATPVPIDVVAEVRTRLPVLFVGAALVMLLVILGAGISIIRGPRDI